MLKIRFPDASFLATTDVPWRPRCLAPLAYTRLRSSSEGDLRSSCREYVKLYEGSVGATLMALHARLFEAEFRGADWDTIAALWADEEFMGVACPHTVGPVTGCGGPAGAVPDLVWRGASAARVRREAEKVA